MEPYVKYEVKNGIGFIEFFHPAQNSLPAAILNQLAQNITQAGLDSQIKVIVLQSGGDRTFCAGASFTELIAINDSQSGELFFSGFAQVINAMRKCPKFIIGRVQGKAVGGGVGLAAAVDYCMATQYAAVKLSELHVGIGPFVVGPAVQRKIGLSAMSQLAIDANTFYDAQWALNKGLYTQVFDSLEALDEALWAFAENLSQYHPEAMKEIKQMCWQGTENWDTLLMERAKISGRLVLSEFTKNTLEKYKS